MSIIPSHTLKKSSLAKRQEQWEHPLIELPSTFREPSNKKTKKRTVYYATSDRKINEDVLEKLSAEKECGLPPITAAGLPYNVYRRAELNRSLQKGRKLKLADKPSRREKIFENFAERLYVPQDALPKVQVGRRGEMDPEVYGAVKERPIKQRFNCKQYIQDLRQSQITLLRTKFLEDEISLIDQKLINDQLKIKELEENYKEFYSSLKEYEAMDREQWMMIRRFGDEVTEKVKAKKTKLKKVMKESSNLMRLLFMLEESWRSCKLCQILLFKISPLSWQEENSITTGEEGEFNFQKLLDKYSLDKDGGTSSINSLIKVFKEDAAKEVTEPQLYFTDTWQVQLVFSNMEYQNLHSMLTVEGLRKKRDAMTAKLNCVTEYYDNQISKIKERLISIEDTIRFEEKRAKELEDSTKELIDTDLRHLVTAKAIIFSDVCVDLAYEMCVSQGHQDVTILDKLEALKLLFEDIMMKFDSFPRKVVAEAKQHVTNKKTHAMRKANRAQRQILSLDVLTKSIMRSLEKPFVKRSGRPLVFRSEPPVTRQKREIPSRRFTTTELEYFVFFTDDCEHDEEYMRLGSTIK